MPAIARRLLQTHVSHVSNVSLVYQQRMTDFFHSYKRAVLASSQCGCLAIAALRVFNVRHKTAKSTKMANDSKPNLASHAFVRYSPDCGRLWKSSLLFIVLQFLYFFVVCHFVTLFFFGGGA